MAEDGNGKDAVTLVAAAFFVSFSCEILLPVPCYLRVAYQCPTHQFFPLLKTCHSQFPISLLDMKKVPQSLSFTVIRKYLQQLIINADKQGASKSREYITFISGRFSAFLLRNKTPFLRTDMENPYPVISMLTKPHKSRTE